MRPLFSRTKGVYPNGGIPLFFLAFLPNAYLCRKVDLLLRRANRIKQELKERIMAGIENVNRYPVIHTWSYKPAEVA
jgi:hypothetical protein